jgi:hypothetical protein
MRRRTPGVCRLRGSVAAKRNQIKPTSAVGVFFCFSADKTAISELAIYYFWLPSIDQFTSENVPFW